jgi:hypothetical protein
VLLRQHTLELRCASWQQLALLLLLLLLCLAHWKPVQAGPTAAILCQAMAWIQRQQRQQRQLQLRSPLLQRQQSIICAEQQQLLPLAKPQAQQAVLQGRGFL